MTASQRVTSHERENASNNQQLDCLFNSLFSLNKVYQCHNIIIWLSSVLCLQYFWHQLAPGPWFNIKMSSYQYRKSHCGDKTILWPSYLPNEISYTGKVTSSYWIGAQINSRHTIIDYQNYISVFHIYIYVESYLNLIFKCIFSTKTTLL